MKFYHFIPDTIYGSHLDKVPNPDVAKKFIPNWYKESEIFFEEDGQEAPGLKTCVPFLDGLLSGYMITLPCNVYIKITEDGSIDIDWDEIEGFPGPIDRRSDKTGALIPRPAGHHMAHLAWTPKWGWKSPRKYSTLVTHPLNRFDLPFTTMSAIVDSDKFHGSGNIPFFIKEGFEGVIEKGTPIAQLIPIKRQSWASVYDPALISLMRESGKIVRGVSRGGYRDKFWVKKEYK